MDDQDSAPIPEADVRIESEVKLRALHLPTGLTFELEGPFADDLIHPQLRAILVAGLKARIEKAERDTR